MVEPSRNGSNGTVCRIGVYVCQCGTNIGGVIDVEAVAAHVRQLPEVIVARTYSYMCSDPGQALIKQDIEEHQLDRVVVASCSPLMHESTFRSACADAGLNPYLFQMTNIREHVAWVHHHDPALATKKAIDLVSAAVKRVARHAPIEARHSDVKQAALVVGAGIAGIEAALRIADSGKQVYLVEKQPGIGGHMAQLYKTFPTLDCAA
jgi:heterodisulfide reductase subunit A2